MKTALVVGGASGIGLASAKLMATNGWRVVLGGRHQERLANEVSKLISKGYSADSVVIDVTSAASVESAFKEVLGKYELNSLIYAAGIPQFGTILDIEEADWDLVLGTNLKGAYLTSRAAVSAFLASGGGTIVNIASQSGRTSSFYSAPNYVASKAGLSKAACCARNQSQLCCTRPSGDLDNSNSLYRGATCKHDDGNTNRTICIA